MRFSTKLTPVAAALLLATGCVLVNFGGSAGEPIVHAAGRDSSELNLLPGMPPVIEPNDIYSENRPGKLSATVKNFPNRIYVPNSKSNTVDIIDPATYKIVGHCADGKETQHVVPS